MDGSGFLAVARVVKPHGLAGELAVMPLVPGEFDVPAGAQVWFVPPPDGPRSGVVESVRPGPKGPLLKVTGIDAPESARAVAGCTVLARGAQVPALSQAACAFDPVGSTVTDEARGVIGTVTDVIVTGANDVWVVDGPLGEVLVPVIDDVVLEVDEDACVIRVRLLPGLIFGEHEEA
ncbi:MAG: 16S rRNA processing protein RimM [Actinobacteria bacterium]|nr:MAG: 16S rRNA processing protein RimM [Actinomycetota bacterium]